MSAAMKGPRATIQAPRPPRELSVGRISRAFARRVARARKAAWQRRNLDPSEPRRPVFLVGCQRSGTNMFHRVLDRSPRVRVYNEDERAAFRDFVIRPAPVIERLIARSPAPVVLFKPLCDSQWTDRLLDRHARSRAVWMYRHYADVANSLIALWGGHQRDTLDGILAGRLDALGWRGERLSPESVEMLRAHWREGLGDHEAAVLVWWLRNRFFFELGLDRDQRVRLVKYEPLVEAPLVHFAGLFAFLGCDFEGLFVDEVFADSVRKLPPPDVAPGIRTLADEMMRELDRAYEAGSRTRE